MTTGQTITIVETPQPRRARKFLLLALVLLPLVWYIARRERDYEVAYSGVVFEKGMDYSLIFGGRTPDLYLILQDDLGKRSKRYICSRTCSSAQLRRWSEISVGTFVVKPKGFGELPYQVGEKPASQPVSNSRAHNWLFAGSIVVCAAVMLIALRQLWQVL